jgi:hypothetical protein
MYVTVVSVSGGMDFQQRERNRMWGVCGEHWLVSDVHSGVGIPLRVGWRGNVARCVSAGVGMLRVGGRQRACRIGACGVRQCQWRTVNGVSGAATAWD